MNSGCTMHRFTFCLPIPPFNRCLASLHRSLFSVHVAYKHTHAQPPRASQVADVNTAERPLHRSLFFNKSTHTLPTSALLLSKHKQTVTQCELGGGELQNISFPIMAGPFWMVKPPAFNSIHISPAGIK